MLSIFDIFSIGIGPSSSHTVGPMRAANSFAKLLKKKDLLSSTNSLVVELYGSLALTGKGHGTDKALILGLSGENPVDVKVDNIDELVTKVSSEKILKIGDVEINFDPNEHILFHKNASLPQHPNGMCFIAADSAGKELFKKIYFSVGGGFIAGDHQIHNKIGEDDSCSVPYPYRTAADLLKYANKENISISEIVWRNELTWRTDEQIRQELLKIWQVMKDCIQRGINASGILPGGLKVRKRASVLFNKLKSQNKNATVDPLLALDWVNLYALSVNEENASGGKVVTAPTNGAAGIIPSVIKYYEQFNKSATEENILRFLMCSGAIAILYKYNASISGADVGCQGEVGVACSMASAGLTEVLGGTVAQVENAAEIAMEHNLGLTCDPIGGLVQVPCIERNAMGAVKAINASRMALSGDGQHFVSLDKVIKTMYETGKDMQTKYKETSRGGLAVNIIEC